MIYCFSDSVDDLHKYCEEHRADIESLKITIVPLTIETFFYVNENSIEHVRPSNYFFTKDHKSCLLKLEALSQELNKLINLKWNFLKKEIIINTRFNAAYICFIIQLIQNIQTKDPGSEFQFTGDSFLTTSELLIEDNIGKLIVEVFLNGSRLTENKIRPYKGGIIQPRKYTHYYLNLNFLTDLPLISSLGYNILNVSNFINNKRLVKFLYFYPINGRINATDLFRIIYILFIKRGLPIFERTSPRKSDTSLLTEGELKSISDIAMMISETKFLGSQKISKLLSIKFRASLPFYIDLVQRYKCYESLLNQIKPSISVAWAARSNQEIISELQNYQNRKSLLVSHGTVAPSADRCDKAYKQFIADSVVISSATHIASQSVISDKFFYERRIKNTVKTPELIFNKDRNIKKRIVRSSIVYATTLKKNHNIQFLGAELYDEFLDNVVDLNKNLAGFDFRVRVHPTFHKIFRDNRSNKQISSITFSDESLDRALNSCLVLISLSSTCIEAALSKRVPVILFDNLNRYKHYHNCVSLDDDVVKPWPLYYARSARSIRKHLKFIVSNVISSDCWDEFLHNDEARDLTKLISH